MKKPFAKRGVRDGTRSPGVAVLTMAYNEAEFLPIWSRYYGALFGPENLYLIDHGSDDGSVERSGVRNVMRVPRTRFDEDHRRKLVSSLQHGLLEYFETVIFTDPDEVLVADPQRFGSLADFVEARGDPFFSAVGLDLLHFPEAEPPIDLARPVLAQRRFVRFNARYCKTLIAKVPLEWGPGFHTCQHRAKVDPDLYLIHLKLFDRGLALARLSKSRALDWSPGALEQNHSAAHRVSDEQFLARFYPHSFAEAQGELMRGFDFSDEIARFGRVRSFRQLFEGRTAALPERFGGLF